ncbi:hypothetical protein [Paraburkholderia aromaticivorans]|uniref:hypothetical protein n=1 Tax=Paraburkholderia aromaticivorans TaxID=2026199 RepID=UPI0038B9E697
MPTKAPKNTIKGEIERLVSEHQPIVIAQVAKAVLVSRHRVQKYCKRHGIDIAKLNEQVANGHETRVETTAPPPPKPRKKPKLDLGEVPSYKINLGAPKAVKVVLDTED